MKQKIKSPQSVIKNIYEKGGSRTALESNERMEKMFSKEVGVFWGISDNVFFTVIYFFKKNKHLSYIAIMMNKKY